ncbi:MAG: hypothetical protein NXI32_27010 [bacterium]|nr:hypothetical protein [bacterium]
MTTLDGENNAGAIPKSRVTANMPAKMKPGKLILFVILAAMVFAVSQAAGWYSRRTHAVHDQQELKSLVTELGGDYYYDYQYAGGQADAERLADADSPDVQRHWLSPVLGIDWFHDIFYVSFAQFDSFQKDGGIPASRSEIDDARLIPLANHPSLRWLALSGTALTDAGLQQLSQLPKLERLWISGTRTTDQGLGYLQNCSTLTHLAIENTASSDRCLPLLLKLPRLEVLSLGSPYFSTAGLRQLSAGRELRELYLDALPVDDSVLGALSQLSHLQTLSIRGARLTAEGFRSLGQLASLQILRMDGSSLDDAGLGNARSWKKLRELTISGTQVTDRGLAGLSECLELQKLNLAGTPCTLAGVLELFQKQQGRNLADSLAVVFDTRQDEDGSLISLDLADVVIRDDDISRLQGLPELQWLAMTNNQLTDAGLEQLATGDWPNLQLLKLDGAQISEAGILRLGQLPALRRLHIPGVPLEAAALQRLQDELPKVRIYTEQLAPS